MPVYGPDNVRYSFHTPSQGGIEVQLANDASRITAPVQVAWEDWQVAAQSFVGYPRLVEAGGIRWISRNLPLPYYSLANPDGDHWLYATSVSRVEGISPDGTDSEGCPAYKKARIWLVFNSVTYDILPDDSSLLMGSLGSTAADEGTLKRYVSGPFWQHKNRQISLRRGVFKSVWQTGDPTTGSGAHITNTLLEGLGFPEPGAEVTYIWHQVPASALPLVAIANCMGKVNSTQFDLFPAGTLLYENPGVRHYVSAVGQPTVDVTQRFTWMPRVARYGTAVQRGWNWMLTFLKSASGVATPHYDYREYKLNGTGANPFASADFTSLFRPDQP